MKKDCPKEKAFSAPPLAVSSLLTPETKHESGNDVGLMRGCAGLFSF